MRESLEACFKVALYAREEHPLRDIPRIPVEFLLYEENGVEYILDTFTVPVKDSVVLDAINDLLDLLEYVAPANPSKWVQLFPVMSVKNKDNSGTLVIQGSYIL